MTQFLLLINTAADPAWVALVAHPVTGEGLADPERVLAECELPERRQLSVQLLPAIETLLSEGKLSPAKLAPHHAGEGLAGIGIAIGPGPFTGLRIGVAVANALALAHQVPIVPLSDLPMPADAAAATTAAIRDGRTQRSVLPEYGQPPSITPPKG